MAKNLMRTLLTASVACAALLVAGQSSNQATVPLEQPASVLRVTTQLVVVDVVATDRKGAPVVDLKQDDFAVTEDGKPQSIRAFNFQGTATSTDSQLAVAKPAGNPLPPNVVSNVRRSKSGAPLAILLLDGINTRLNNQDYAKQQLLEFLKKLPADQPIAVYLLGTKLRLIQDFTSDPNVLKAVVQNLKDFRSPLMENANGGPVKFWLEGMPLPAQVKQQVLQFQQETESSQADQRVAITLTALNQLARTLAGYPGRKNLIWVSETFPFVIVPNKVPVGQSAERARRNYTTAIATTASLISNAQIAVYPVDARGLMPTDLFNVAARYDERGDANGGRDGAQAGRAMDDTANELMAARGTMEKVAEETGGRAFYNRNDLGNAVRESIADGATYYTLGYYPTNKSWDGHYRKINIHVTRPGVTLRYRLGYYALGHEEYARQSQQHRDAEFSGTLSLDVPISTALPFTAAVLPASSGTANKTVVNFAVDAHALSFSPAESGKQRAGIECAVRVFRTDSTDKALQTESDIIDANLPPESYDMVMRRRLPCRVELDLPAGEYLLRLGVRDNNTGLIGTANIQWTVPAAPADGQPPQGKKN
ncbi:MAG TPA: VWA domain-containing protein [Candidatus Angelobacter sp.]|jgi:VWFA-related protein